jgi:hypothetical protein
LEYAWEHTLKREPRNPYKANNMGSALITRVVAPPLFGENNTG